jgi:acetyl esterase/lipase
MLLTVALTAGAFAAPQASLPLWPDGTPNSLGVGDPHEPTITPFLPNPTAATGAAVVVLPGGGYGGLAAHEGAGYAEWLAEHGIAAFVVKYRIGSAGYRHPVMLQDASRAIRIVRSRAAEWNIDPNRVGIMGSSAGGHLASTLSTHFDAGKAEDHDPVERQSSRPDLSILCYPVVTMLEHTHKGSRKNLLGETPSDELLEDLSNERRVSKDTPPTFIFHTWDDPAVPVENALQYAVALRKNGVPCEMHLYQHGPHGIGLGKKDAPHPWSASLLGWFSLQKFLP